MKKSAVDNNGICDREFAREVVGVNFSYVGDPQKFGLSFELINHLSGVDADWTIDQNGQHLTKNLPPIASRGATVDRRPGERVRISQTGYYKAIWEYAYRPSDGGHEHKHATDPLYNNGFPDRVVLNSGESRLIEIGPASGIVVERVALYTSPSSGSVNYYDGRILILDLVDLGSSPTFVRIGSTATHPSNHYVTASTKAALWGIAQEYYDATQQPLYFNDASLVWGGIFDINGNFAPPHSEHREGRSIDIAATSFTMQNESKFVEILNRYTSNYIIEGDGNARHFHVRF